MVELAEIESPEPEETIVHLRRVILSLTGFALGQGLDTGRSPEEVARELLAVFPSAEPALSSASPEEVEHEARDFAAAMEMAHGNVVLVRDENVWTTRTTVAQDRTDLERWGASIENWARFVVEQERRRAERMGIAVHGALQGDVFSMKFSHRGGP